MSPSPIPTEASRRLGSSLRCNSAQETLARATPLMDRLGISRVTDITRLDRLGLPVHASIRPRGQALCVNAGKGVQTIEARVGALMEAIEFAVAEPQQSQWKRRVLRLGELADEWNGDLALLQLAPRIGPAPSPDRLVDVVACEDLAGGPGMPLPAELVFVPFGDAHGTPLCGWSTNGLASGNSVAEATLHALLEVLERDAIAMNLPCDVSSWLPPAELPAPFAALAHRWQALGVALSVRFVPNEFGLPCFRALLHERDGELRGLAQGTALHLDAQIALARAVCEAAQSRLSHIHGGRDDITRYFDSHGDGRRPASPVEDTVAFREAFDTDRRVAWRDVPSWRVDDAPLERLLGALVDALHGWGFRQVLRHRFACDLNGLHVVKVIVPRCEPNEHGLHRMGERLFAKVAAHA
ncbi:MAG: YcaO-like family protein [Burkholderiaceae bacterium]